MRLINNEADPQLVGVIEDHYELQAVEKQVKNLNQDLIDSGFNQYQYKVRTKGNKVYVEKEGV